MGSRVSLANKCLAIFGCAIVVIIASTLAVPWVRSSALVHDYQMEVSQQLTNLWLKGKLKAFDEEDVGVTIQHVMLTDITIGDKKFAQRARNVFEQDKDQSKKHFTETDDNDEQNYFKFARPITQSQLNARGLGDFKPGVTDPSFDSIVSILIVKRKTEFAQEQIDRSQTQIIIAGVVGSVLSALIFFIILKKLIFSPVRKLRRVSERVQQGDLTARSTIATGDEFEELSIAFNEMLNRMEADQQKLQKMNESLDLKVEELAEVNIGLFESGKLKNEFLANVSHELRTPLNSIIGFAELLESMKTETEEDQTKRLRYLKNILTSGRALLDMINELLDMAKIEAGRMEANLEPTSIADLLEGLSGIMRPQAKTKGVTITLDVEEDLPTVQTDPGKLQQILYNFLSNAIKFTPKDSVVTIRCNMIDALSQSPSVQICVQDCGPGIPEDMMDMVFEKFRQVDATHTREHAGTGLGLAICRELAELLHANLSVQSKSGDGASFFVEIPVSFAPETPEPLMPA